MHFSRSKATLESLESVFKEFQGAPEESQNFELNRLLIRKSSSFASKTRTLRSDWMAAKGKFESESIQCYIKRGTTTISLVRSSL